MSKSIMQSEKESYFSKYTQELERHHIFFGNPGRRLSEQYGCWVWLTGEEHRGRRGPHMNYSVNLRLKRECQVKFESIHGHEKFMEVFGRNYI